MSRSDPGDAGRRRVLARGGPALLTLMAAGPARAQGASPSPSPMPSATPTPTPSPSPSFPGSVAADGRAPPAWPVAPIRLLVAYAAGGMSDGVGRSLAEVLTRSLGVPVLVENRPGAGGRLALAALARAAADGHTLALSAVTPLTLSPWLDGQRGEASALRRALTPVIPVLSAPLVVVGTPAFTGQRFEDLQAQARARPGALRWATSGHGTLGHMVLRQVSRHAGAIVTHVPYTGGGPQLNDALAGRFELLSTNVAPLPLRHVASGHLRPLAVSAPVRVAALPQVPTLGELGLPQADLVSVFGLFAPGGMAPRRTAQWHAAVADALRTPVLRERLRASHNEAIALTPEGFAAFIDAQSRAMQRLLDATPPP